MFVLVYAYLCQFLVTCELLNADRNGSRENRVDHISVAPVECRQLMWKEKGDESTMGRETWKKRKSSQLCTSQVFNYFQNSTSFNTCENLVGVCRFQDDTMQGNDGSRINGGNKCGNRGISEKEFQGTKGTSGEVEWGKGVKVIGEKEFREDWSRELA